MDAVGEFLDSTDLIGDGPGLARRLRRDGYLFLRGLLPRDAVLEVRRRQLEKAAAGSWLDPGHPVEEGIANTAASCKDPEDRYMQVFRNLWVDEALHRLRTHPIVLTLFESIFGEPALAHPLFVQRNIFRNCPGRLICHVGPVSWGAVRSELTRGLDGHFGK